ncbi:MAG: hypothetical protein VYC85_01490, partial [Pseudomonadota bacterium]|nr:hypothetical protein [Pseudomonadota bacterium]
GEVAIGSDTDIDGVVFGDGAQLSAATAQEIRIAADLDTSNSPTFSGLSLTGDITLSDGATITVGSGTGSLSIDGSLAVDSLSPTGSNFRVGPVHIFGSAASSRSVVVDGSGVRASTNSGFIGINDTGILRGASTGDLKVVERVGSALGNLELSNLIASGNVDFSGLPTSDPAVAGRLWNDSGTLKISAG